MIGYVFAFSIIKLAMSRGKNSEIPFVGVDECLPRSAKCVHSTKTVLLRAIPDKGGMVVNSPILDPHRIIYISRRHPAPMILN